MIYILAYILLGISTGVIMRFNGKADIAVSIACVFVWPLYWFAFVFAHFVGWMPAKCAWCGKSVAGHAHMDKWRAHYLDECDQHPLAIKCKRLDNYLDETDAKNTYHRVQLETAIATIEAKDEIIDHYQKLACHNRELADANEVALDAVNKQLAVTEALLQVETARANRQ